MAIHWWTFNGYVFPVNSQPTAWGGADEWNAEEKILFHLPINSNIDIITSYGFKSARRTITGRCSQAARDNLRGAFLARAVGYLIDGEGTSRLARIEKAVFKELFPNGRYEFTITFVARD